MLTTISIIVLTVLFLSAAIRILNEYERGVIFRLGRVIKAKGPGLIILIPVVDKMVKVSMRLVAMDVDPQDVITRDNVSVKVNAVIYFRVIDPIKAIVEVENYSYAMAQLAQTTLRSVCGQAELDELLSARDKINTQLQEILDMHTDPWGIKVATVELKHIDLPQEMQRAMAKQAEAERERRAKVINAEGEFQASTTAGRCRRDHPGPPDGPSAPLSADHAGNVRRAEHHHDIPFSHGPVQAVLSVGGTSDGREKVLIPASHRDRNRMESRTLFVFRSNGVSIWVFHDGRCKSSPHNQPNQPNHRNHPNQPNPTETYR